MRYLITGHTGFKGAWLAAILKEQGHELVGISLPPLDTSLYKEAALTDLFDHEYFIDIRNREEFTKVVKESGADIAFHLAAQPLVRESYKFPIETFETNVIGTLNFLEGIKNSDISAAIVITTDKVYKNKNLTRGYVEGDELGGHDPYSSSKAAADIATQSWVSSYESKNISIARAGNVIGGGDWGADRLMPDLVRAFNSSSKAEIRYPDAVRPWQHVADCLNGYIALSKKMLDDQVQGEWNFGPEINIENTVAKVANLASQAWGEDAGWSVGTELQPHEAGYLLLDSTKARTNLGWADKLEFSEAIKWSMEFYKDVESGTSPRKALEDQIQAFLTL